MGVNEKTPVCFGVFYRGPSWQEREDSNPRPLVLETSALARLSYAPATHLKFYRRPGHFARGIGQVFKTLAKSLHHSSHSSVHSFGPMPWKDFLIHGLSRIDNRPGRHVIR